VARTVDPEAHAVRRDAFLDAAQALIMSRGYDRFSVQDILNAAGASKGAFYHYFDSKESLLDAIVDRMADQAMARIQPLLDDEHLTAPQKLQAVFGGIAEFKSQRRDLIVGFMRVWSSDDNAIVRERLRGLVAKRQLFLLEAIVRQGIAEGSFTTRVPDDLPRVLVGFMSGMSELAMELWTRRQEETITLEEVKRTFDAYLEAFERIVGTRPGTLRFLDEPTIAFWYG
jgi:AcrR family transcriptional regulator